MPKTSTKSTTTKRTKKKSANSKKMTMRVVKDGVKIFLDDESVLPIMDADGVFGIKAGSLSEEMMIPPRMTFKIDCGFAVELPRGVVPIIAADEDFSQRGLILTANTFGSKKQRFTVMAHNAGKQILAFDHGQPIGQLVFANASDIALIPQK